MKIFFDTKILIHTRDNKVYDGTYNFINNGVLSFYNSNNDEVIIPLYNILKITILKEEIK